VVTAPDGTPISDGSLNDAVYQFQQYARSQLGKIDGILTQLRDVETQVRALQGDTTAIRQATASLQQAATALRAVSFSSNPPRSWLNRGAAQAAPTPGEFGAGFGYQGLANSETILGSGDFPSADALKVLSEVSKKKT